LKLLPFSIEELTKAGISSGIDTLLLNGFYPRIYDASLNPTQALGDYLETYVERDIRQLTGDLIMAERLADHEESSSTSTTDGIPNRNGPELRLL